MANSREGLMSQCRYYRGGDNPNTDGNMVWFWDMERVYVQSGGKFKGEEEYYKNIKGKEYKGIPYPLLMIMFTSWGKTAYNIKEEIDEFYKLIDEYLFIPNDHFPEDEIPDKL